MILCIPISFIQARKKNSGGNNNGSSNGGVAQYDPCTGSKRGRICPPCDTENAFLEFFLAQGASGYTFSANINNVPCDFTQAGSSFGDDFLGCDEVISTLQFDPQKYDHKLIFDITAPPGANTGPCDHRQRWVGTTLPNEASSPFIDPSTKASLRSDCIIAAQAPFDVDDHNPVFPYDRPTGTNFRVEVVAQTKCFQSNCGGGRIGNLSFQYEGSKTVAAGGTTTTNGITIDRCTSVLPCGI